MTIQKYFKGILEWSYDFKRVWMGLTDRRKMVNITDYRQKREKIQLPTTDIVQHYTDICIQK